MLHVYQGARDIEALFDKKQTGQGSAFYPVPANSAIRMSLISRVVPSEKVTENVFEQSSTTALRASLKLIRPDDFGQGA